MILSRLTRAEIARHFDPRTMARAVHYAENGATSTPEIDELETDYLEASAHVAGSGGRTYVVYLYAELQPRSGVRLDTECDCPVGEQCKHGAAVALVLGRSFARSTEPQRPPTWEGHLRALLSDLGDLAASPDDHPGLGIGFSFGTPGTRSYYYDAIPRVRIRPLRPGKRQAWVKSGVEWSDVPSAAARHTYDTDQLTVLLELSERLRSGGAYGYALSDPALEDFGSDVVPLLERARAAGVTFVPTAPLTDVRLLTEPLGLVADAARDASGTTLTMGLAHEGRLWSGKDVLLSGDPAHTATLLDGGRLVVARLERRLPPGPVRALRAAQPVVIPVGEAAPDHLRALMRLLPVTSEDASVELPEPVLPALRLGVAWASSHEASVSWCWSYAKTTIGITENHPLRDAAAERALLAGLPQRPDLAPRTVTGVEVLHLALLELPSWREVDGVEVIESNAPDFRESASGPDIDFTVPAPDPDDPPSDHTDWLDLEVNVTVEGERVPLPDVLAALTLEQEHLILPSGLFIRTDRDEFAALHDVVRAAAELREQRGDRVRVSGSDLGLWAQLADLGVVDAQAAEWVARAQALRDLTELPRPEPTGIVSTLRGYQLEGFHWLAFLWQHQLGGILADDMGLGKTLQVLALVAHTRTSTDAPFLVVAPTSVVSAWESESTRHTPGLTVRAITSASARRGAALADVASGADVVVTSYTLLRLEADDYAALTWAGVVLDEAHVVKNHQSKVYAAARLVPAPFRLAVTGTPFENRLLELWSLLSIVAPGIYPHPRGFVEHVVRPVEKLGDEAALRRFTRRIRPFLLRRTKELVAADLPPKQEQVLRVQLNPRHRRIYDAHLAKERQRILGLVDDDFDRNRVAILAALTTLRQLALDPALTDPDHERVGSAKIDVLVEHLVEITAEGHRALVFSTFTGFLRRVRDRLERESLTTTYLDGSTRRRAEVIDGFRSGEASVFLISLKAGGVGLTLTEADYVFVLDPWWNPAAEAQAVDRAHRIGQRRSVMVYRLVSEETIEDKVMALKERKAALFARVIDGDGAGSTAVTADDIRALFD